MTPAELLIKDNPIIAEHLATLAANARDAVWDDLEGFTVLHEEDVEEHRWYMLVAFVTRHNETGLLYGGTWQRGSTERQENEYDEEFVPLIEDHRAVVMTEYRTARGEVFGSVEKSEVAN